MKGKVNREQLESSLKHVLQRQVGQVYDHELLSKLVEGNANPKVLEAVMNNKQNPLDTLKFNVDSHFMVTNNDWRPTPAFEALKNGCTVDEALTFSNLSYEQKMEFNTRQNLRGALIEKGLDREKVFSLSFSSSLKALNLVGNNFELASLITTEASYQALYTLTNKAPNADKSEQVKLAAQFTVAGQTSALTTLLHQGHNLESALKDALKFTTETTKSTYGPNSPQLQALRYCSVDDALKFTSFNQSNALYFLSEANISSKDNQVIVNCALKIQDNSQYEAVKLRLQEEKKHNSILTNEDIIKITDQAVQCSNEHTLKAYKLAVLIGEKDLEAALKVKDKSAFDDFVVDLYDNKGFKAKIDSLGTLVQSDLFGKDSPPQKYVEQVRKPEPVIIAPKVEEKVESTPTIILSEPSWADRMTQAKTDIEEILNSIKQFFIEVFNKITAPAKSSGAIVSHGVDQNGEKIVNISFEKEGPAKEVANLFDKSIQSQDGKLVVQLSTEEYDKKAGKGASDKLLNTPNEELAKAQQTQQSQARN